MNMVALIPARAGSKRLPGKNIRLLGGKPLMQWTIEAAQQSGVFASIQVSTEDQQTGRLALQLGADWVIRPDEFATDAAPDIVWVRHAMQVRTVRCEAFAILRPTSPFRTADTIRRAFAQFKDSDADSIRAMERWDGPHPGKMWTYDHVTCRLFPVVKEWTAHAPYHSSPTQSLVPVLRQNASLEMAHARVLIQHPPSISGTEIAPFFTEGDEGFDINTEADWTRAEQIVAARQVSA